MKDGNDAATLKMAVTIVLSSQSTIRFIGDLCNRFDEAMHQQNAQFTTRYIDLFTPLGQRAGKKGSAERIFNLFTFFEDIAEKREEFGFTHAPNSWRTVMNDFSSIVKITRNALDRAQANVSKKKDKTTDVLLRQPNVSDEERSREGRKGGGTTVAPLLATKCLYCEHMYIDEPPSNGAVRVKNKQKFDEYVQMCAKFDAYHKDPSGKSPPKDAKGNEIKNRPNAPTLEDEIIRCHCSQLICKLLGSDEQSTCPMKCRDAHGNKYIFKGLKCQCPICVCTCNKSTKKLKQQDTMASIQESRSQGTVSIGAAHQKKKDELNAYLTHTLHTGTLARESAIENLNRLQKTGKLDAAEDIAKYAGDIGHYAQAMDIVRNNGNALGRDPRIQLTRIVDNIQGEFPHMVVQNGKDIDTRALPGASNKSRSRRNNNGLQSECATASNRQGISSSPLRNLGLSSSTSPSMGQQNRHQAGVITLSDTDCSPKVPSTKCLGKSPSSIFYERMEARVSKNLFMGKKKADLSHAQKESRKFSKQAVKSLVETKPIYKSVVKTIATGRGVPLETVDAWLEGKVKDEEGELFDSQKVVGGADSYYAVGYMSCSDEE